MAHFLVELAKKAVESYIEKGEVISPFNNLPKDALTKRAGTFVSIFQTNTKNLRGLPRSEPKALLRGCIGTYLPTRINVAEEVIRNAIAAATEDCRFNPIEQKELSFLRYTVYILSYPEPVKDIKELDPKKFGIIVKTGPFTYPNQENVVFDGVIPYKTGLLLPDLDGVDTIEKQISITCQKGGIDPTQEKTFIYKFTVEKYQ